MPDGEMASFTGPHPVAEGKRIEPRLAGRFELIRGLFSPGVDPPAGQNIPQSSLRGVVLGDCNADGLADVYDPGDGGLYVQRAGGTFERTTTLTAGNAISAAVFGDLALDAGGPDGNEDLVLGNEDITVLPGLGECRFDPPRTLAPKVTGWAGQIIVRDVDKDGLADLSITRISSFDASYRLLIARGDGSFDDAAPPSTPSAALLSDGYISYSAYFDDADGDGTLDLFAMLDRGQSWYAWGVPGETPSLLRDEPLSQALSLRSPMGMSPLDVDRDGRLDYFMAIGKSRIYWNRGPRDLVDFGGYAGVFQKDDMDHWGSLAFDADLDGWTDLLVLRLVDGLFTPGAIALYVNRHDATFADVGDAVFGGTKMKAQALVCGDLESTGKMSCFAREPGGTVLLKNQLTPPGHFVGLRLRGTVSSADASGARVSLDGEARPLILQVSGQAPSWSEHRRDVLIAIGDKTEAAVTITWPSGLIQSVPHLAAGSYTAVVEPRVLWLARRVTAADGTSTIVVTADPGAAGATRDAKVTIESDGSGAWQGPVTLEKDGTWSRTLVAPSQPGIARITLTLDGKPLQIRPRIRFTAG